MNEPLGPTPEADATPGDSALLRTASRSLFWNATLLPLVSLITLVSGVYLRRTLGLESGLYDAAIGLVNAILVYGSLGLSASIPQFVPELRSDGGGPAVRRFLTAAWGARLAVLALALVPVNLLAEPIAARLQMGDQGVLLLRLVSAVVALRAVVELGVRSLQSLLAHLSANLVQILQSLGAAIALIAVLAANGGVPAIFQGLVVAGLLAAVAATAASLRAARQLAARPAATPARLERRRFVRFAAFMYVYDLAHMFSMPAFASPALAVVLGDIGGVALFNTAFQIPMMIVVVVLAGFQGLYRPLFATVLAENDRARLRTAFAEVTKVQMVLLLPAGAGLTVLLGDLIPLLFTATFAPAVPLARILCAFLFLESMLNLGIIILSTDHRYRSVLAAQSLRVATAPVFVLLASYGHLTAATWCFAIGRLAAVLGGYLVARSRYGLRLPWAFAARVGLSTGLMVLLVASARQFGDPTWPRTLAIAALGAGVFALVARWGRLLGPRELDLLSRARFPGSGYLLRWMTPKA